MLANAVALSTIHHHFGANITGSNQNTNDALAFLSKSFENLTASRSDSFIWAAARDEFVENFSRLATKSQAQVGHNGSKTFADIHAFVTDFAERNNAIQRQVFQESQPEEVAPEVPSPSKNKSAAKQSHQEHHEHHHDHHHHDHNEPHSHH